MSRQTSRKEEHLEAFRGTVESLTNTYDVGQEKLTALLNELDTLKDDIAELREKGEEMVGLTTASALASVFQQTSGDLLRLYNLQVEHQIRDRLSFMRFLGLGLEGRVPDAKTVWLARGPFRRRPRSFFLRVRG